MQFTKEKVSEQRHFPTAACSLDAVTLDLTNGELVKASKKEICQALLTAYMEKFPEKRIASEKFQMAFDSDPMHAWAVRDVLEGRTWDSPRELMEAYAKIWPSAHRDARRFLNTGLAYALDKFTVQKDEKQRYSWGHYLDKDLQYVRETIINNTLLAHQRMREAFGIALPEETFDDLAATLSRGITVRVEQDLQGARLVLAERIVGEVRDVDMERLNRSHYCIDVSTRFAFEKMQEIFEREVRQGNKVPVTVELLETAEKTVEERGIPHRFVVLCSKFEYARGEPFQRAREIAYKKGLESLVAAVDVPVAIPEVVAVLAENSCEPSAPEDNYMDEECGPSPR